MNLMKYLWASFFSSLRLYCLRQPGKLLLMSRIYTRIHIFIFVSYNSSWSAFYEAKGNATIDKICLTKLNDNNVALPAAHFVYVIFFHRTIKLTQDSFPVNRTSVAYAVCTFWEGGLCKPPFTANSIKALGSVLIGRLYFWFSSSPVLLPLRKGSAANVKLCDNRAIRHSTEFDPTTSLHDGCEMIPSPRAQHDTLSTTQIHSQSLIFLCSLSNSLSLSFPLPLSVTLCYFTNWLRALCCLFKTAAITTYCCFKKWWLT